MDALANGLLSRRPSSTYRLQFHKNFRFQDAQALLGYLAGLGVTHVYSSPILQARTGSMHGYDITDHTRINPEIGTEEEFRAFVAELKGHGMALILDTVPNHMGVGAGDNPWWQDVLENGRTAKHADFFDIDWHPLKAELQNKVLLPILGSQYGEELEAGHLKVNFSGGRFVVRYYDKVLPLDPQTVPMIFAYETAIPELDAILHEFNSLPLHSEADPVQIAKRRSLAPEYSNQLAKILQSQPDTLRSALERINGTPGDQKSFDGLHRLLEAQPYRLAHWRVSAEEINYRRFFDVNDLVGLRMDNPAVFAATHHLIRRLLAEGSIHGVRVDHCDGMLNPRQYLVRLQMLYAASQCGGPDPVPPLAENGIELELQNAFGNSYAVQGKPLLYCIVEKILEPGEELPLEWPVDGTSGYDFTNQVNGIFIAQQNERAFTNLYKRFTGESISHDFEEQLYWGKKVIMHTALAGEINVLAHLLDELSSCDRRARDFTRKTLRDAIREVIACFPVYRSYIDERGEINERDRMYIQTAIALAKRRNAGTAAAVFDFLENVLLLQGDSETYSQKLQFVLKFQQLTGPVMAKGMEDTVFYTYNRFISLNEVGGWPDRFGISLDEFHKSNSNRNLHWPFSMLATSTHDSKRGEDVRARLNVLSENPGLWSQTVMRWKRSNQPKKVTLDDGRVVPDDNEEYLLYQTLLGAWPLADSSAPEEFVLRISDYMEKALHEAKTNSSWINPDQQYISAMKTFISRILLPGPRRKEGFFLRDFQSFLTPLQFFGALNSLAQTLLKITSPGVPDIYQGCELWNFSLVDPDNRRPVNFELRKELVERISAIPQREIANAVAEMLLNYTDGRIKLWITMQALRFRRQHPELFRGSYHPIHVTGDRHDNVCAFSREASGGEMCVTAVARFAYSMTRGKIVAPVGDVWGETELLLPPNTPMFLENQLTHEMVRVTPRQTILCRELFRSLPLALLAAS